MSVLDKFLNIMRLNPDDDDDFYNEDYDDYDDDYEDEPVKTKTSTRKSKSKSRDDDDFDDDFDDVTSKEKQPRTSSKVTPIRPSKKQSSSGMEVCVIKPTSVEDAREITETLLNNRTVVLNVEGLDVEIAQRIIDFTSGSCFAISGNLQKISNYIFIITPSTVDISGDFLSLVDNFQGRGLHSDFSL
ncbi:MAG: cell division protein SepF [Roseburia sp.]|jgi:cell division inhibitor SepF|nr:cell division protein SepF [Roseburia sp.]